MGEIITFDGSNSTPQRVPPYNVEAERALLGAILVNNRAYENVSEYLIPDHFTEAVNGRIYGAIAALIDKGQQANPITLKNYLERDELVVAAGGLKYIASLSSSMVTLINVGEYGRLIYDLHLRRELICIGEDMVNAAYDSRLEETVQDQIQSVENYLFNLATHGGAKGKLEDFNTAADAALELADIAHRNDGKLIGVTSGLRDLDKKLGGLHNSDLLILAGRPSQGKTGAACAIAFNAAQYFATTEREDHKGKQVAFFSLEMSKDQLLTRILSHAASVDSFSVRSGKLTDAEFDRFYAARQNLRGTPLWIDDTPAQTVAQLRGRSRRLARKGTLGLIVIDYLQLISAGGRERPENRVNEISAITRALKALAKELNVPVIALSQLSRAVEQRDDKRPHLADLRDSGSIEQDSDVVMFVYREQYYLERHEPQKRADESNERFGERYGMWTGRMEAVHNMAEIIIGKQRHGPIGTVRMVYSPESAWFSDIVLPEKIDDLFE